MSSQKKQNPLYKKVVKIWQPLNEGAIMQHVIFPLLGSEQPIMGSAMLDPI